MVEIDDMVKNCAVDSEAKETSKKSESAKPEDNVFFKFFTTDDPKYKIELLVSEPASQPYTNK